MDDLLNISINITGFNLTSSNTSICEVNQIAMLNTIQKMPKFLFLFISLAIVAMVLHLYILPWLQKSRVYQEYVGDSLLWFSLGSMFWAWLFSLVQTYTFNSKTYEIAEYSLLGLFLLIEVFYAYKMRHSIKSWFSDVVRKDSVELGKGVGGKSFESGLLVEDKLVATPVAIIDSVQSKSVSDLSVEGLTTLISSQDSQVALSSSDANKPEDFGFSFKKDDVEVKVMEEKFSDVLTAYCVKCRKKQVMSNHTINTVSTVKGVKKFAKSKCPVCGTTIVRLMKS